MKIDICGRMYFDPDDLPPEVRALNEAREKESKQTCERIADDFKFFGELMEYAVEAEREKE